MVLALDDFRKLSAVAVAAVVNRSYCTVDRYYVRRYHQYELLPRHAGTDSLGMVQTLFGGSSASLGCSDLCVITKLGWIRWLMDRSYVGQVSIWDQLYGLCQVWSIESMRWGARCLHGGYYM